MKFIVNAKSYNLLLGLFFDEYLLLLKLNYQLHNIKYVLQSVCIAVVTLFTENMFRCALGSWSEKAEIKAEILREEREEREEREDELA